MEENQNEQKLDIVLTEETAKGSYSNLQIVQHSPTEFIIDFIEVMPNMPKAPVVSRIILNPIHAKKLLTALHENVGRYEMAFGKIDDKLAPNVPYPNINPMGKA